MSSEPLRELRFTEEQRDRLGLEAAESVRVLASGPHTVLLERVGADASGALPWDRHLALSADVRAFSLAGILQLIHSASKSGFLFFEQGEHAKSVFLHGGEVVFAASNQAVDRLGQCLLRTGVLTLEQYREATDAYTPEHRFGRVLVERGYLTPRELWSGVRVQVEEIVRSMFAYAGGLVHFWEGEARPDNVVRLSLPTRRLVAEGLKRRDDLLRFLTWLEDPRTRLERVRGEKLTGTEQAIFQALALESSFTGICRVAGLDPLTCARTIQMLRLLGAVKVVWQEETAGDGSVVDGSWSEESAIRASVWAHAKLLAELAAPIVAVEGETGIRERLSRVLSDTAARFPALLGGIELGRGAVLDPEPLVTRALRNPGERGHLVREALGELVSYLEFELANHPGIEDPDDFLEGLEPLRASL